ncbi:MAG: bifunctional phosphoribosylaminoimidazolecarboxamide formyltransferase/IMP cyclohydrolase [Gammaproteobacteria bacterium]
MNQSSTEVKRVLISVSDKTGIVEFARGLHELDIEIISTGGTSKLLRAENIPVRDVSDLTDFPEMMDGRVKTLHPKVHGGILGLRDEHAEVAKAHHIHWIDLVVVNLYPFAETIKKSTATFDDAVENIDIGGPTMIRSAAKNMGWVGVVIDPQDYDLTLKELRVKKQLTFATRKNLATKAFEHTAEYDAMIYQYLAGQQNSTQTFPDGLELHGTKYLELRYGENPHQAACAYRLSEKSTGVLSAKQYQGKELSYNNIADADAAVTCVREFSKPACVIVKHANPCGVASADNIFEAFERAFKADSLSAFGGIIALNRPCTKVVADAVTKIFFEVLIAPGYTPDALELFASKPNLRVLELNSETNATTKHDMKFIDGGVLIQEKDIKQIAEHDLKIVTKRKPSNDEIQTMLFAWPVLKQIKSNAILIAKNNATLGVGAGQVSRVDAVDIALKKAGENLAGAILASDAFFPFRDSIDRLANTGIHAIIQPGGSMRDDEVIAACDEHNIAMVFTGTRCFKH